MKIFLSWSDTRSRHMARALRGWLPLVLHYAEPWFSDKDIPAGERWSLEVGKRLEDSDFGIICLTRENIDAPWILFEAGALSKALSISSVCPFLLDVDFSDITGPLSQFQAKKTDKSSTLDMVSAINEKATDSIEEPRLKELFEVLWPKLEQQLENIPQVQTSPEHRSRPDREILEELVENTRAVDRRLGNLELDIASLRFSADVRPSARSKRIEPIALTIAMEGTKYEKRGQIKLSPTTARPTFLEGVSNLLGLGSDEYGTSWFFLDNYSYKFLTREDCQDIYGYFGTSVPSLTVTDDLFADVPI